MSKTSITEIHYSNEHGWHVDVLPEGSEWSFQVIAPDPRKNKELAEDFLLELRKYWR